MVKENISQDSEESKDWWEVHQGHCDLNQFGSSSAMECAAATNIFMRSKEKLHLRYTEVISDGDTKTVSHLNDVKPYSGGVIVKHECVGHVQKHSEGSSH